MPWVELVPLLALGLALWLWVDSLRARDVGVAAARAACAAAGYLFLDDTVAISSLRPTRNARGTLTLRRVYEFEFSDTGDNRRRGWVSLIGRQVETTFIGAYLVH